MELFHILAEEVNSMRTIVVDDEPLLLKSFAHISEEMTDLHVMKQFTDPEEALEYAKNEAIDLAILDIAMPGMNGVELLKELRKIQPEILIVFITAYDKYIRDANELGADDYIIKPYTRKAIQLMVERMKLLSKRQTKKIYIQTFGRFTVFYNGKPVPLRGKAKEILALIVTRRGKEISNEEIYMTIWENRQYSNYLMKVYYNALKRLKVVLEEQGIPEILQSTAHGQLIRTEIAECDFYDWMDAKESDGDGFAGEFMSEYSWGEPILADIITAIDIDSNYKAK